MKLLTKAIEVNVSGQTRKIDIAQNDNGNLVFLGIGAVKYEMYDEELLFMEVTD